MSGEILAKGRFRVDRRRALDKMEKFQLEDPYRYVLEVLVAARCAEAARIEITNDADDFVARWEGDSPDRDELEALFDHLFGTPEDDHGRMLQHLALAAISSLALKPRWLRIDGGDEGGAHRIEITDPTETVAKALAAPMTGVRFDLREQFGHVTITEALALLFQEPVETRLIRGASRWYPLPIVVNGAALPRAEGPTAHAGAWSILRSGGRSGAFWLAPATGAGRLDVLRHGIVVSHYTVTMPRNERTSTRRYEVVGWFDDENLRLNASRSAVVQDEAWSHATEAIDRAVGDLLQALGTGSPEPELVRIAIGELRARSYPLGALAGLPCATDLRGRSWTFSALTALAEAPGWTSAPDLFEQAEPPYAVFSADLGPWLDANVQGCKSDVVRDLARRAEGRRREHTAVPTVPRLGDPQRIIDVGTVQGAVRLVALTAPDAASCTLTVVVRGRELERVSVPAFGGNFVAVATDSELTADPDFKTADRTSPAWSRIANAVTAGMRAELRTIALGGGPRGQVALGALCANVTTTTHVGAAFAARVRDQLDPELLHAPVFRTGDGRHLALADVMTIEGWYASDAIPDACPEPLRERVLLLAPGTRFERWLGCEPAEVLHAEVERARRLSAPRRAPVLQTELGLIVVNVQQPGLVGQLGVPRRLGRSDSAIEVLRDGFPVESLKLHLAFAGVIGVIDIPDAGVNRAHDKLTTDVVYNLPNLLASAVNALAIAHWQASGVGALRVDPRILAWAAASGLAARHDPALLPCPAVAKADGTELTFADLDARQEGTIVVREPPPAAFQFNDVVVATSKSHVDVLLAWLGKAGSDGAARMAAMKVAYNNFLQQPDATDPAALAERRIETDGYEATVLLPRDPRQIGVQHVEARYQRRVLGSRKPGTVGAWVAAWGPSIEPNEAFDGARDGELLRKIGAQAAQEFEPLVEQALAAINGDDPGDDRSTWLALLSRLKPKQLPATIMAQLRSLRTVGRVDGAFVSIDEVASATRAGAKPRRLPPDVATGAAPHPWYLYEPEGIELVTLVGKLPDGTVEVKEHREALHKLGSTPRREAKIDQPTFARGPLQLDGHVGEIGLFATGAQLVIQPLHEGIPLDPLVLDFPLHVQVVVAGPSIKPDRALTRATPTDAWNATGAAIKAAAEVFVRDTLLAAFRNHGVTSHEDTWWTYAMADQGRGLRVLPLGSGGFTSRDELDAVYAADKVVGFVTGRCPPFVAGAQPVRASDALQQALRERYKNVVDLNTIATRHRNEPGAEPPGRHAVEVPGYQGSIGLADAHPRVEIYNRKVLVEALGWDRVVPLRGWLGSPDFAPTPRWEGLTPDARAPLERALERASIRVLNAMIDADPSASVYRDLFERALFTCCPDARSLQGAAGATEPASVAARLAQIPLFTDTRERRVSLRTLVSDPPIRAVQPGTESDSVERRYVQLADHLRARLALAFEVVEADEAFALELKGLKRRAENRFNRRQWSPGNRAEVVIDSPHLTGRLALWPPDGTGEVAVVVDGSRVCALDLGVPGLCGFIEGAFEVDPAFTSVELLPEERAVLDSTVGKMLVAELDNDHARLSERLALVDGRPTAAWGPVAWFFGHDGEPLTFAAISALVDAKEPVPVELSDDDARLWWARLFPRSKPSGDKGQPASKSARDRQRREVIMLARRLAPKVDVRALRAQELDGPAFDSGSAAAVFAAWELVARVMPEGDAVTELDVLLRVAAELGDVTGPHGG